MASTTSGWIHAASSSSELTEAINSMFRWYQRAERCYVYLADVSMRTRDSQLAHAEWASALRNSRWFKRGWTLQELLAPRQVEFYSRDRVRLGDRKSLMELIHEATRIDRQVPCGGDLFKCSIEQRLAWATGRQTTAEEDMAYALLGICDVHMPLIYGEGHGNAMQRLREEISKSVARETRSTTFPDPNSIVDFLKSRGQDSSIEFRKRLANQLWIREGLPKSAEQNTALLKALSELERHGEKMPWEGNA